MHPGEPFLLVTKKGLRVGSCPLPSSPGAGSAQGLRPGHQKNQTGLVAVQKALCVAKQRPPEEAGEEIEMDLIWKICHL